MISIRYLGPFPGGLMRPVVLSIAFMVLVSAAPAPAQTPAAADSLLDRLAGHWHMSGTVQGEKGESHLAADRVLQGKFVRLHLTDLGQPSQYEAMVFLGVDSATSRVVAHWIDVFGAGPSATLGYGTADGNRLVLDFAYPTALFATRSRSIPPPAAGASCWRPGTGRAGGPRSRTTRCARPAADPSLRRGNLHRPADF
jgi:hypothetical protein